MSKMIALLALCLALFQGEERYLNWNPERKPMWDDFQGPPDYGSEMLAHTTSRINYHWKCEGGIFSANVEAVFDREKSWKKELLTDKLLDHERLHFDVTELYARRLRQVFSDIPDACALSAEEIKSIAADIRAQWKDAQDLYDLESDHGRDTKGQESWLKRVEKGLADLVEYELE